MRFLSSDDTKLIWPELSGIYNGPLCPQLEIKNVRIGILKIKKVSFMIFLFSSIKHYLEDKNCRKHYLINFLAIFLYASRKGISSFCTSL